MSVAIGLLGCLWAIFLPNQHVSGRLIDLTHDLRPDSIIRPHQTKFKWARIHGVLEKEFEYVAATYCTDEHMGTHIDAPTHVYMEGETNEDKWSIDEIPIDRLIGPAVVIDFTSKAKKDRGAKLSIEDLLSWEKQHGEIPKGAHILLRTGLDVFYKNPTEFFGTNNKGPGPFPNTTKWLLENRQPRSIGTDWSSIDDGSTKYDNHFQALTASPPTILLERLTNLNRVNTTGSYLLAMPVRRRNGTAAPARIMAAVNENWMKELAFDGGEWVDLTWDLGKGSQGWPLLDDLNETAQYSRSKYTSKRALYGRWCSSEHLSTHSDAPNHFWFKSGINAVHEMPPTTLSGPAVVFDIADKVNKDPEAMLTRKDIEDFERKYGTIPQGSIPILRSGWHKRYGYRQRIKGDKSWKKYWGTNEISNTSTFKFPGYSNEATKFLVHERKILGYGVASPSPDNLKTRLGSNHEIISKANAFIIENVGRDIDKLPPVGATLFLFPMKIYQGTGAPGFTFAFVPNKYRVTTDNAAAVIECRRILVLTGFVTLLMLLGRRYMYVHV